MLQFLCYDPVGMILKFRVLSLLPNELSSTRLPSGKTKSVLLKMARYLVLDLPTMLILANCWFTKGYIFFMGGVILALCLLNVKVSKPHISL